MKSSQEKELGAQELCGNSGTPKREDSISADLTGPGPTPLKYSQLVKALLPRLRSTASYSLSLSAWVGDSWKQPRQELLA